MHQPLRLDAPSQPHRPQPEILPLEWKGVAIALVKALGLHEGIWGVWVEFAIVGMNANVNDVTRPAALIPVQRMGLRRETAVGPLSVDAAVVNPESLILVPSLVQ